MFKISKPNSTAGCFRTYLQYERTLAVYLHQTVQSAAVPDALFPSRVWVQPRGQANIVILLSPGWVGPGPHQPAALHQTSPL